MHHFRLTILAATLLGLGANQAIAQTCPNPVTGTVGSCTVNSGALKISATGVVLDGVYISGAAIIVANDGQINNTPGSLGQGVDIGPGASLVSLTNSGTINGDDSGVRVDSSVLGTIENSGVIKGGIAGVSLTQPASVITTIENRAGGLISSDNQAIFNIGTITKLNNSGRIEGSVQAVLNDGGTINEIANQGVIASKSGVAIENTGTIRQLFNSGSIVSDTGTAFSQTAGSVGIFQNSGSIIGGATGIRITGGTVPFGITNSGVIAGATAIEATVVPVSLYNSGLILGRINLAAIGSDITNAGIISLRATDAASKIEGAYAQTATGLLNISAASSTSYGKLVVADAAVINGGIQVTLTANNTIAAGQTLSNVVTAGPLSGSPIVKDTSLNLDFVKVQDATSLSLTAVAVTANGPVSSTVAPGTVTQSGTVTAVAPGTVVQPIVAPSTDAAVMDFCSQPGSNCALPTTTQGIQQVAKNIEEPVIIGGTQQATMTVMRDINRVIQARRESNLGLSSGDGFYDDKYLWMRPFGSWGEQKERNGVAGYDSRSGGIMIGTDGLVGEKTRVGLALTYAKINLDGNSSVQPQTADVAIWNLLGYGSYAIDDVTDVNFHAGIGKNSNKAQRTITGLTTTGNEPVASSRYDGQVATVGVGLGRTLPLSSQTRFIPSVRADYVWVKEDGYTEDGASPFNLQVDGQTASSLVFAVDGKIRHDINRGLSFFANLGVGYDVINDQASINALIAG